MNKEKLIVEIWEKIFNQHSLESALIILNAVYPKMDKKDFAQISFGNRNYLLIQIYNTLFGKSLECVTICPECSYQLEFSLSTDEIIFQPHEQTKVYEFNRDNFKIIYKLPDSYDLASASKHNEIQSARNELLNRCIIETIYDDKKITALELPEEIIQKLSQEFADNDPNSEILINLVCQNCNSDWTSFFDISSFLVKSINFSAKNILRDVHTLALVYGWSEADILNMTPQKRNWYINLSGA